MRAAAFWLLRLADFIKLPTGSLHLRSPNMLGDFHVCQLLGGTFFPNIISKVEDSSRFPISKKMWKWQWLIFIVALSKNSLRLPFQHLPLPFFVYAFGQYRPNSGQFSPQLWGFEASIGWCKTWPLWQVGLDAFNTCGLMLDFQVSRLWPHWIPWGLTGGKGRFFWTGKVDGISVREMGGAGVVWPTKGKEDDGWKWMNGFLFKQMELEGYWIIGTSTSCSSDNIQTHLFFSFVPAVSFHHLLNQPFKKKRALPPFTPLAVCRVTGGVANFHWQTFCGS